MPSSAAKCCCNVIPPEPGCWRLYVTSCSCPGDPLIEEVRYVECDIAADCEIFRDTSTSGSTMPEPGDGDILCFRRTATELTELTTFQQQLVRVPRTCYEDCETCCEDDEAPPECNFLGCDSAVCCEEDTYVATLSDIEFCGDNPFGGNHVAVDGAVVVFTLFSGLIQTLPCVHVSYSGGCLNNPIPCVCSNALDVDGVSVTNIGLSCGAVSPESLEGEGTGACCVGDSCFVGSRAACDFLGGVYRGDATACTDLNICNVTDPRWKIVVIVTGEPASACFIGLTFVQAWEDVDQELLCPTGTYHPAGPWTGTITVV